MADRPGKGHTPIGIGTCLRTRNGFGPARIRAIRVSADFLTLDEAARVVESLTFVSCRANPLEAECLMR